jgi:drug/metabolite transporter (DMT)-like permease
MFWIPLALATALFESLKDVFSKRSLRSVDPYTTSFALRLTSFLLLSPILFFIEWPVWSSALLWALLAGAGLNVVATILYMKALQVGDLSLTVPFVTFTPLFLLLTSPIIVGEFPNLWGIAGIILIVSGSYLMNVRKADQSIWAPFRALWDQPGPRYMMGVAMIWSVTSNIDKIGVQHSSPLFWAIAASGMIALLLWPITVFKQSRESEPETPTSTLFSAPILLPVRRLFGSARHLWLIGLFTGLTLITQMMALELTLVAYVIAIKRTSAVLAVLWGIWLFKEKAGAQRLSGAVLMVVGVVLITVF